MASLAIAASAIPAAAYSATANFGSLLSGSFTPAGTFASLSVAPAGTNVFNFTLTSNNLNSLFTNGAFIGGIAVNSSPDVSASSVSVSNFSGVGIDGVSANNGGGPTGVWDFRFDLGNGGGGQGGIHRLGANESASWTATFSSTSPVQLNASSFALHVQGLSNSQGGSAWYSTSAVSAAPEPEIYALMIAGLILVRLATRRGRTNLAT
jgi:hypothetical protein